MGLLRKITTKGQVPLVEKQGEGHLTFWGTTTKKKLQKKKDALRL